MLYLGFLIGLGAAIAFVVIGALALFGGVDTTQRQLLPGFTPDRVVGARRVLVLLLFWLPILVVAGFCLLAGIQILQVIVAAISAS
jgi:predicted outer membrane lipoprotein